MNILKENLSVIAAQNNWDSRMLERDYHIIRFLSRIHQWDSRLGLKGSVAFTKVYFNNYRLCKDIDLWLIDEPFVGRKERVKVLEDLIMKLRPLLQALNLTSQSRIVANAKLLRIEISYHSLFTASQENFKIEIILFSNLVQAPTIREIKHSYEDIGSFKLPIISLDEAVGEKLKGALSKGRKFSVRIRDIYDLWRISESGFNFEDERFINLYKQLLVEEGNKFSRSVWSLNANHHRLVAQEMRASLKPFMKQNEVFDYRLAVLELNKRFSSPLFGLTMSQYGQLVFNRYRRIFEDIFRL